MSKEAKEIFEKIPGNAGTSTEVAGLIMNDIIDKIARLFLPSKKSKEQ